MPNGEQEFTLKGLLETFGTDENVLYLGCDDHMRGCIKLYIYNEATVLFTYTLIIYFNSGSPGRNSEDGLLKPFRDDKSTCPAPWPFHHPIPSPPHKPPPQGARELLHMSSFETEGQGSSFICPPQVILESRGSME